MFWELEIPLELQEMILVGGVVCVVWIFGACDFYSVSTWFLSSGEY